MGRALFPVSYFFGDSFNLIILNKLPCFQIEYAFPENLDCAGSALDSGVLYRYYFKLRNF